MTASDSPPAAESLQSANSRSRAKDARRQAILEAAEAVFAEHGFGGATMSEIAARSGYSAGNLYNVFENKEALFTEVLVTRASLMLRELQQILRSDAPVAEVLDRYVDATLAWADQHRGLFVILTQTHLDFDWGEAGATDRNVRDAFDRRLEEFFARAVERGELAPTSPRSYACLLQGTLNAHMARWARGGGQAEDLRTPVIELSRLLKRALGLEA
jgi:AcrR family transcriptional regulator